MHVLHRLALAGLGVLVASAAVAGVLVGAGTVAEADLADPAADPGQALRAAVAAGFDEDRAVVARLYEDFSAQPATRLRLVSTGPEAAARSQLSGRLVLGPDQVYDIDLRLRDDEAWVRCSCSGAQGPVLHGTLDDAAAAHERLRSRTRTWLGTWLRRAVDGSSSVAVVEPGADGDAPGPGTTYDVTTAGHLAVTGPLSTTAVPPTVHLMVTVGDDGLPRRLTMTTQAIRLDYRWRWDTGADVTAPRGPVVDVGDSVVEQMFAGLTGGPTEAA